MQWQFARQWEQLRDYGKKRGIGFIGDMPIFVSADSADAWAHPDLFTLHHDGTPELVAGVPPDYFSKTGQLWGNPHYRWDRMKRDRYAWWVERFKTVLRYFNVVRIDHFIGFVRYYAIPAGAKDATSGQYKAGPGAHFFHTILKQLNVDGKNALIAEDLGTVTPEVKQLRDQFELPGMKVLQFAFGTDPEALNYQPHNYPHHCIVYTGTHDNNTTLGWFREEASKNPREKDFTLRYLNSNGRQIHWDMIRAAMASPGATVIIPVQDILGLGSRSRMNFPGKSTGNWEWRILPHALTSSLAGRIRDLTEIYQRQL